VSSSLPKPNGHLSLSLFEFLPVSTVLITSTLPQWRCSVCDFKLEPQSRWGLLSSRLSRNVGKYLNASPLLFYPFQHIYTAVAQWLRCCATNRKVAGSIPAGVNGFFIDKKSFRSHYGPGVDSASNRNEYQEYFLGGKGGRCVRLTTYYHPVPLSRNLGTLTSWNPLGHSRPVTGLLYLIYIYIYIILSVLKFGLIELLINYFRTLFLPYFFPYQCVFLVLSHENTKGLDLMIF